MRIAIFGATGETGRRVCRQALDRGHEVVPFSHSGKPIEGAPELSNTALDVRDAAAVTRALAGVDAIVSTIGGPLETRVIGLRSLIAAADAHRIARIIGVGGAGALHLPDGTPVVELAWFPAPLKPVTQMHLQAVAALEASALSWTFICPPMMQDGPVTESYKHAAAHPAGGPVVRYAEVAHLIMRCLDEGLYVGQRVGVSS